MKKTCLLLLLMASAFLNHAQDPQGFFLDNWAPTTVASPPYTVEKKYNEAATVTIDVDFNIKVAKVSPYIYGNNSIPWAGKLNNDATLVKNIDNLSPNILRCPGGSLSDEYFWNASETNLPKDVPPTLKLNTLQCGRTTANWAMTLDNYYDLLTKTHSTGIITINYGYARYGTSENPVNQAAHYAANWVRYDKGRTRYWEIGNEVFGNWESGYKIDPAYNKDHQPEIVSGDLYGKHCLVYIDSMKAAGRELGVDIKIGVVAMEGAVSWDPVMNNWNAQLLPLVEDKADFVIIHSYYTPYNENSTIATILNSASITKTHKDYVINSLKTYGKKDNLPVALTEWNIFATGSKQAVSYINGMHAALVLGELIKNQYGQATRWDLLNGWGNGDDHGLFASGDEPGVKLHTPHAPFFYLYYFRKYFGDQLISSKVTGSTSIVSYASSFSSGQSGIVVINKGTTAQSIKLKVTNIPKASAVYRYVLTGGTDNGNFSRKVFVNGQGPSGEGGGPDNYTAVKALAGSINGDINFPAPPLSVTYLLVTGDSIPFATNSIFHESPSLRVFPNPVKDYLKASTPDFAFNRITIMDVSGRKAIEITLNSPVFEYTLSDLHLKEGIYLLKLSNKENSRSMKFLAK
jgi:hypothetical protein